MGIKIDGKRLAQDIREELKKQVENINNNQDVKLCMANILVGNDGGSQFYVRNQNKLCHALGIKVKSINLDECIKEEELLNIINELNNDNEVKGIILQLPLPKHLDESKITSAIDINKDIDGLNSISVGKLYKGEKCFVPCTPRGIIELIKTCDIDIEGSNAVVIGRSNIVGKPVAQLLLNENATVTICHSKTKNLKEICLNADILVSAIGKPHFITKDYVKEGAVVIDVGTSSVNGKMVGDVCFDEVIEKAAYVTPVPGGVGAMTTTMLIKNLCEGLK